MKLSTENLQLLTEMYSNAVQLLSSPSTLILCCHLGSSVKAEILSYVCVICWNPVIIVRVRCLNFHNSQKLSGVRKQNMIDATAAIPNSIMMNAATKGSLDLSVASMLCRSIPYGKKEKL